MQKRGKRLLFLGFSIVIMLSSALFSRFCTLSIDDIAAETSQKISAKSRKCLEALKLLESSDLNKHLNSFYNLYEHEQIGLYLFKNDSLVFWNNSQIPIERDSSLYTKKEGLVRLKHGAYVYFKITQGNTWALALCVLKPKYDLQNNYLKNDFEDWICIPDGIGIETENSGRHAVMLNGGKLFSLKGDELFYHNAGTDNIVTIIFLLGFACLLMGVLYYLKKDTNGFQTTVALISIVFLRCIMLSLKWPDFFYRSILYDLRVFGNAQSILNSYLGDILLNAMLLLFVAVAISFLFLKRTINKTPYLRILILSALIFLVYSQFNFAVLNLVTNSTLSFDFLGIFNFKPVTFVAITALCFFALALFVLVSQLINCFEKKSGHAIFFILLTLLICYLQQLCSKSSYIFENYWLLLFSGTFFILKKVVDVKNTLALSIQLLLVSLVTSKFLNIYIDKNQKQDLEILSLKLGERQDAVLESEFLNASNKLREDEGLKNLVDLLPGSSNEIPQLLREKFFNEYFNRYNVDFSLFDKYCNPLLNSKQAILLNEGFFDDQIKYNSDSTQIKGLFFVKNYKKNARYIGKIELHSKFLYVFMEPKQFEELGSFPDLLLDQSQQKHEKLKNFSWAVYRAQQNTNRYGNFNYPLFLKDSRLPSDSGFTHHYFKTDESTQIIITTAQKKWNYFFTFNSYLLLFFSLITYCTYLIYALVFTSQFKNPSLTRRIQTIIIALLLLAMSAVGITSGSLVTHQFELDNKKQLEEKTEIIINELASQFKTGELFDESQKEIISSKLNEYARLFNSDISLFSKEGYLFNTSQPRLYNLGLAAPLANPVAYSAITRNFSSAVCLEEKAGSLNYLSLYTPLYDSNKNLNGFINLPYFAKQGDLVSELSGIISTLINVYVILFVLSILAGLILSSYITQPLRLIKQQIAGISLGSQNEKINWQSNDEIGKLVSEYNQMLIKLEHSAGLLAQSERESAWREMAKQVAHEIKNPLTPMKLNLQYLQHLLKNNSEDFNEKFAKSSASIIEQIDALAIIASEFSNFAKLPVTQLQSINLKEIIKVSALIFENEKNIAIVNHIGENDVFVKGDKDQCLRVFNNILKNAIQALEDIKDPCVELSLEREDRIIRILIKDNGCGIDENLKPKIFSPNFTTKSTGSGLCLAMVKNIMEGFGGSVRFESEKNRGSVFYLEFEEAE